MSRRIQVSVPLTEELRALAQRAAAREDRKLAAWIRRVIVQAAQQAEQFARQAT
jgi:hypothetical protein